jgi:methylase of polypeptide subunit release factors
MKTITYSGLDVFYEQHLIGGGQNWGHEVYAKLLDSDLAPVPKKVFEWCSGPAFIGFSLLARGLCQSLCLADINPEAVAVCRETVKRNGLEDRVSVYLSDNMQQIPESEQFDLVVGNPPHFDAPLDSDVRTMDPGWEVHKRFYCEVGDHLTEDGFIIIIENNGTGRFAKRRFLQASTTEILNPFIEDGGLKLVYESVIKDVPRFYWTGIMHSQQAWEESSWKQLLT